MATDSDPVRPPRWDGISDFFEEDDAEPYENVRRILARPPDAITGEPFDPDAVPGSSGDDVTPPT
jgi:hypothetical protein